MRRSEEWKRGKAELTARRLDEEGDKCGNLNARIEQTRLLFRPKRHA